MVMLGLALRAMVCRDEGVCHSDAWIGIACLGVSRLTWLPCLPWSACKGMLAVVLWMALRPIVGMDWYVCHRLVLEAGMCAMVIPGRGGITCHGVLGWHVCQGGTWIGMTPW